MPCFHAVCNRKCAGWKHLCLARRGAAWYAHGRQRDSSPPERMSWPRRKSGSFFMTDFTGHKKRPDLIRGGPCPLELPSGALSVSLPHLSNGRDKPILTGFTGHKKRPDRIRGGPCPLELPRDTLSVSLPHLSNGRDKPILTGFTGHKKGRIAFEAGLTPSSSPATLYLFPCRILTIDSKKSTLPKQRALYMVCVWAGWRRIRQPSSPWPALRAPCCPRQRGR
jgi:hypothetical protein